jgi:hypothetical protein
MSTAELDITPSESRTSEPRSTGRPAAYRIAYAEARSAVHVAHAKVPPDDLRVTLQLGQEGDVWWARIPELDVSGEGQDFQEAFRAAYGAAYEWLAYLRDEHPDLSPELANQERYVPLLDVPGAWFRDIQLI